MAVFKPDGILSSVTRWSMWAKFRPFGQILKSKVIFKCFFSKMRKSGTYFVNNLFFYCLKMAKYWTSHLVFRSQCSWALATYKVGISIVLAKLQSNFMCDLGYNLQTRSSSHFVTVANSTDNLVTIWAALKTSKI